MLTIRGAKCSAIISSRSQIFPFEFHNPSICSFEYSELQLHPEVSGLQYGKSTKAQS
jgi:hypothetical protein